MISSYVPMPKRKLSPAKLEDRAEKYMVNGKYSLFRSAEVAKEYKANYESMIRKRSTEIKSLKHDFTNAESNSHLFIEKLLNNAILQK